jgi:hypothetical protein
VLVLVGVRLAVRVLVMVRHASKDARRRHAAITRRPRRPLYPGGARAAR